MVNATPRPLYPRERYRVSPRTGLDWGGKFPPSTGIRSPDRPAKFRHARTVPIAVLIKCQQVATAEKGSKLQGTRCGGIYTAQTTKLSQGIWCQLRSHRSQHTHTHTQTCTERNKLLPFRANLWECKQHCQH